MRLKYFIMLAPALLLAGCMTRSISDSDRTEPRYYYGGANPAGVQYQGELSEFDVLGIDAGASPSEEDIGQALDAAAGRPILHRGDSIMLVQSGAMIPDAEMVQNLEMTFAVTVFTGVPERTKDSNTSYSRSLRLAAAKAGINTILVYWGVLESGTENLAASTVSWVPIVGYTLPDKAQTMRIRLKIAAVDVRTGRWEMFAPKALDDRTYSSIITRKQSDQAQVATLKKQAYSLAADSVLARYVR